MCGDIEIEIRILLDFSVDLDDGLLEKIQSKLASWHFEIAVKI